MGCVPPPHLSPFVDIEAGHVPEYAEAIERLKAAEKKQVLPLPGMRKEVSDNPNSILGRIDRQEAIEAADARYNFFVTILNNQYEKLDCFWLLQSTTNSTLNAKDHKSIEKR